MQGDPKSTAPRRPSARLKWILCACSTLAALLGAELLLRIQVARANQQALSRALRDLPQAPSQGPAALGHLIQQSPLRDVIYELRPNLRGPLYAGARVRTNSHGFRGAETPLAKRDGEMRILGLGDSVLFGQGVRQGQDYLSQLIELLNDRAQQRAVDYFWTGINTAVPGYNTAVEVALLRERGLAFEPDLVLLGFVSNDLGLPGFVRSEQDPFDLGRSYLWDWGAGAKRPRFGLSPAPTQKTAGGTQRVAEDPEHIPEPWRHLVGWDSVLAAMDELRALSEQNGFKVLVFSHRDSQHAEAALQAARERGFETLGIQAELDEYMRAHDIARYRGSELTVSEADPHPSAIHHALAARALFQKISAWYP